MPTQTPHLHTTVRATHIHTYISSSNRDQASQLLSN